MKHSETFQGKPVRSIEYRGETVDYVANELVVRLRLEPASDTETHQSIMDILPPGSALQTAFDALGIGVVALPEGSDILEVAQDLEKHPFVASAEPNLIESES